MREIYVILRYVTKRPVFFPTFYLNKTFVIFSFRDNYV